MERSYCHHHRKLNEYADIVRNLTEVLQERNKTIQRLEEQLKGVQEQLYQERKNSQELRNRCDRLRYHLFCADCRCHLDQPRAPGECIEFLNCQLCKQWLND